MLSEGQVGEMHLVRVLLEEAGLVEPRRRRLLRTSRRGDELLAGPKGSLQATLFRIAFWRVSLNLFGAAECGSWPQQQIGAALWTLSTTGDRLQDTPALMKVAVLPEAASWRKCGLFDRFLGFDTELVRTEGSLH